MVTHTDITELIRQDLIKIFETEPLGLDQKVEYAISFPVLPTNTGPQISFLLILAIPSVVLGEQVSSGHAFPGLRPSYDQLKALVQETLADLFAQKQRLVQQATAMSPNGDHSPLDGVPRFDLTGGLPPV